MSIDWFKLESEEDLERMIEFRNPEEMGWVLGRFSRTAISTVRYIGCEKKWQNWDYSWCSQSPKQWAHLPEELEDGR